MTTQNPALGRHTDSVSKAIEPTRTSVHPDAYLARRARTRARLIGLRCTSQAVLATVKEEQRPNPRTGYVEGKFQRQVDCGKRRIAPWVTLKRKERAAHFEGVLRCGRIWSCPPCAASIRARRAEEIQTGAVRWLSGYATAGRPPGSLIFLTLTLRHDRTHDLDVLFDTVMAGWRKMLQGRGGTALRQDLRMRGFVRAVEVTVGKNGWHPHLHLLLFVLDTKVSDERLRQVEALVFAKWAAIVDLAGLPSIDNEAGRRHAVTAEAVNGTDDLVKYLCKVEGMDPARDGGWGVGNEMARGDLKRGRKVLSSSDRTAPTLSPNELLEIIQRHRAGLACPACQAGDCSERARATACYIEFVSVTQGRRAIEWSRGLKAELDIDEKSDEENIQEDAATDEALEDITPDEWSLIVREQAQEEVLHAAEHGGQPQVRRVLARLRRLHYAPVAELNEAHMKVA